MNIKNLFVESRELIKDKVFYKFFLLFTLPILILIFFVYTCNSYYSNQYRTILTNTYSADINKFLETMETEFSNFTNDVSLLLSIPAVNGITYTNTHYSSLSPEDKLSIQSSLHSFTNRIKYTESVAVINRTAGFVATEEGIFDLSEYFKNMYIYDNYNIDYWMNYHSTPGSVLLLNPTVVKILYYGEKTIIPAVLPVVGMDCNSIIIFNIDAQNIYDEFCLYDFTKHTRFAMINNTTGKVYAGDNTTDFNPDLSQIEFLYDTTHYIASNLDINGKKHFLLASQNRYAMFGFTYICAIPYSDIDSDTYRILISILILAFLLILSILIYAYFGSLYLIRPWHSLAGRFSEIRKHTDDANTISYVNDVVTSLMDDNTVLSRKLTISQIRSQQRYLLDLLVNPNFVSDEAMNLMFRHKYFISIAINISTKQNNDIDKIILTPLLCSKIYEAIESIFADKFDTFSLPSANNTLYLILNTETDICNNDIDNTILQIKSLLLFDSYYIDVFIGKGKIYNGIENLCLSHREALSELFNSMNSDILHDDDISSGEYSFDITKENILINYILNGRTDDANKFIRNIFKICAHHSPESKSTIYSAIYHAIGKVIESKNIRDVEFNPKTSDEILSELLSSSDDEIMNRILSLTENIANTETSSAKNRIAEISNYITEHFNENLYLDHLAQIFNVTPKYLSKLLKEHLGISFKAYLTQLRIDKAKELLARDDMKINEICTAVGFMNHSAFIRAFKLQTGISPSEYRENMHKKKGGRKSEGSTC